MIWIVIAVLIVYVVAVTWAARDAFDQTDMGCLWLTLFVTTPVLSVIAYLLMRAYVFRRREPEISLEPREYNGPLKHFGSEIEKARFIEAAASGPGTMYDPSRQPGAPPGGYRHFTDNRAETLIAQGLHGEAFEYLAEMYQLARDDKDGRGQDTYLYYIHRLPGGTPLLAAWEKERRTDAAGNGGDEPEPPSRKVPF